MSEQDSGGFNVQYAVGRLEVMRRNAAKRDERARVALAMRAGDYDAVAPGMLPEDFDKPLVANLIDTAAHDLSEVMAPLPSFQCGSSSVTSETKKAFHNKRSLIANGYIQKSSLATQMYVGADRFATLGYLTYFVEPDFDAKTPIIRVDRSMQSYFAQDYRDRVVQFAGVSRLPADELCHLYPDYAESFKNFVHGRGSDEIEVVEWHDKHCIAVFVPDLKIVLSYAENPLGRPSVVVVSRPSIDNEKRGQFDDVIGVQIGRAIIAQYTMSAVQQSVEAPIQLPTDVQEFDMGAFSAVTTNGTVQRVNLNVPPGLFPEQQVLAQEQRVGSRYPEGRSGSIDASIITGQGVQALAATFDTQIQTFQRLNEPALEEVVSLCFEWDQLLWPNLEKSIRVKDAGSPVEIKYTPAKDIKNDFSVDVSYGAIAGLDPNRGLIFILQAISGGMMSRETGRRHLPVEMDDAAESKRMDMEAIRDAALSAVANLSMAIPQMAANGQDPRQIVEQVAQFMKLREGGSSIEAALVEVFAPKEQPADGQSPEMAALMAAQAGAGAAQGLDVAPPQSPGQDLLMQMAGITPSGNPNMQANVSRMGLAR